MSDGIQDRLCLTHGDLQSYFGDALKSAAVNQSVELDDHEQAYLVDLLVHFSSREALINQSLDDMLDQPVAIQLSKAMFSPPARRFTLLKQIGDFCLYFTGFFSEAAQRRLVDADYYMTLGGGAYLRAARSLPRAQEDNPFVRLFKRLAVRFSDLVGLITEIRDGGSQNTDILRLYERFMETGCEKMGARLRAMGVAVAKGYQ